MLDINNDDFIIIVGPMYASKSKKLIDFVENLKTTQKTFEAFKPSIDSRDGDFISSREYKDKRIECKKIDDPNNVLKSKSDVLIIDEAQFFDFDKFKEFCEKSKEEHRKVVIAMLDKDCFGKRWRNYELAKKMCNKKIKLKAKCSVCQEPASYTKRIGGISEDVVQIEGKDVRYEPRCREHF